MGEAISRLTQMNTFLRVAASFGMLLTLGGTSLAQVPKLPPAPSCGQVSAQYPTFWEGRFSGTYEDLFDKRWPISARACFRTEYECRRWINEIQTIVMYPGFMTCRPASRR